LRGLGVEKKSSARNVASNLILILPSGTKREIRERELGTGERRASIPAYGT
jgi:hypothetical protein